MDHVLLRSNKAIEVIASNMEDTLQSVIFIAWSLWHAHNNGLWNNVNCDAIGILLASYKLLQEWKATMLATAAQRMPLIGLVWYQAGDVLTVQDGKDLLMAPYFRTCAWLDLGLYLNCQMVHSLEHSLTSLTLTQIHNWWRCWLFDLVYHGHNLTFPLQDAFV
ncbi:hypothetical protein JCGZ_08945 [Jatropha curcas]|uniref:Uncharacterized protein n=1 Tax=Jatropha curcas TaxID=180498 RepID=A0A067KHA4_JATCU|nr:hypothetical protein JCGZ_08945 [Jatropha curcas]